MKTEDQNPALGVPAEFLGITPEEAKELRLLAHRHPISVARRKLQAPHRRLLAEARRAAHLAQIETELSQAEQFVPAEIAHLRARRWPEDKPRIRALRRGLAELRRSVKGYREKLSPSLPE